MTEFIKTLLSLSFSGTLLLLILFLLKPLYKNKFSKSWQYYIWLVVALRFLLPVSFDNHIITITSYLTEKVNTIENDNNTISSIENTIKTKQSETKTEKKYNLEKVEDSTVITENASIQEEKSREDNYKNYIMEIIDILTSIPIYPCLFFLWLIVALTLFLRKILLYQKFVHYIQVENIEVTEVEILNLFYDCKEIVKTSKMIELYYNPFIGSPIMIGFFHPKIILSTEQCKKKELFYIFLHELLHYKHRDMFYKWFIQIIICIHWFNPFIYLLGKEINRACELSCDEAIISLLGDNSKKEYGDVLVSALRTKIVSKKSYTYVSFAKNTKQIKERLGAIMDYKKKTKVIKIITTVFTVIICICFATVGVYASNNKSVSEYTKTAMKKSEKGNVYIYNRQGFFHNSYVIEMGWNINSKEKRAAAEQVKVTLKDKSEITIYFDSEAKKYAKNKKALNAIKELINKLNIPNSKTYPEIKEPCIYRIDYVNPNHIPDFAKKCYKENDIAGFSAVFSKLDTELQKEYYKKAYNRNDIAFFACIAEYMDKDTIISYMEKAIQDEDVAAFSLLLDELSSMDAKKIAKKYIKHFYKTNQIAFCSCVIEYLDKDIILSYIEKAIQDEDVAFFSLLLDELPSKDAKKLAKEYIKYFYKEDEIAFFSMLLDYLLEEEKQTWLKQADKDEKEAFYSIISDEL